MTPTPSGCSYPELSARAHSWVRSWPPFLVPDHFDGQAAGPTASAPPEAPYWTTLPIALVPGPDRAACSDEFLRDTLWGQFCLFLFIRIQDDLFDGQATDARLHYVADQFLLEAERAFGRRFARHDRFWTIFHDALEATTRAIVRVDALQKDLSASAEPLLDAYAEVAAIFKVGTAGVCLHLRRPHELEALSRFADEMAIAGQIVDDLEDMEEDLQRGRFNYAARRLLAGSPLDPVTASPRIVRELVLGDGVPRIVTDVRDRVRRASAALGSIEGAIPREQVAAALRAVDQLERQLYREGAEVFFRSLSEGRGAAART